MDQPLTLGTAIPVHVSVCKYSVCLAKIADNITEHWNLSLAWNELEREYRAPKVYWPWKSRRYGVCEKLKVQLYSHRTVV